MGSIGFCHEHALILYVYLPNDDAEDSVLTVSLAKHVCPLWYSGGASEYMCMLRRCHRLQLPECHSEGYTEIC